MTPTLLLRWRRRLKLTQEAAAGRLGISPRYYQNLEYGARPIPVAVALACKQLEEMHD